jgi:hypothetical protein
VLTDTGVPWGGVTDLLGGSYVWVWEEVRTVTVMQPLPVWKLTRWIRICIGMHIANQALFIDVASLLWAVSIEKAVGADGKPIVPSRTECVDEGLVV